MYFSRPHPNHLFNKPHHSSIEICPQYFPGSNIYLCWEYWRWVDEGGTIDPAEVALAIQYPILYSFLKKKADIRTREAAHEFIMNGLEAEADGICALKGVSVRGQQEAYAIAHDSLMNSLANSTILLPAAAYAHLDVMPQAYVTGVPW